MNFSGSSPSGQTLPPQAHNHGQQHSAPILSPTMSGFTDHGRTMIPDRYSDPTGMDGSRIGYNDRMLSLDMNGLSGAGIPGHPNKMLVRNIKSYHCRMCEQVRSNSSQILVTSGKLNFGGNPIHCNLFITRSFIARIRLKHSTG